MIYNFQGFQTRGKLEGAFLQRGLFERGLSERGLLGRDYLQEGGVMREGTHLRRFIGERGSLDTVKE